mmetsp:Transcript_80063/g.226598  ORF Transcript_80063/g.226598 Transcript_80063/m.226598 type:complete len:260 (-) Transcript_80063:1282-2061(-)
MRPANLWIPEDHPAIERTRGDKASLRDDKERLNSHLVHSHHLQLVALRCLPDAHGAVRRPTEEEVAIHRETNDCVLVAFVGRLELTHAPESPLPDDALVAASEDRVGRRGVGDCQHLVVHLLMRQKGTLKPRHRGPVARERDLPEGELAVVGARDQGLGPHVHLADAAGAEALRRGLEGRRVVHAACSPDHGADGVLMHRLAADGPQERILLAVQRPHLEVRVFMASDDDIRAWQVDHGSDLMLLFLERLDALQAVCIP